MSKATFALIIGPTAVGKNTVLEEVLKRLPDAVHVLSTTCRPPRPGEVDGRDYHFLDCEEFQRRAAAGDFYEHAQYSKHWYGTSRSGLERTMAASPLAIKIVEIQGARQIKALMPEALTIFIVPGDFEDLPRRWKLRASDKRSSFDADDLERRLTTARGEITAAGECDRVITNWDGRLEDCINAVIAALTARRPATRS